MKTLERINVYNIEDNLTIGYLDSETYIPDIENINLKISELTEEQQLLTNECLDSLKATLEPTKHLVRSLMQITFEQHCCEERILIWFNIDGEEEQGQRIYPYSRMELIDQDKYNSFKVMCNDILQS